MHGFLTMFPSLRFLLGLVGTGLAAQAATLSVADFGAVPDGATLNTVALQKAIDACSAQGGGILQVPAGRYVTGTIVLKNGVVLRLASDAVLLGSTNAADYRNIDPFTDGTGAPLGYALVTAIDAVGVGIEGPGAIDGRGAELKAAQEKYLIRPFLVRWVRCAEISVREVQLRNSGAWTMHFFQSKNVRVDRVTIRSRGLANNDGIDIDSSENVSVTDCDISTGDDAICFKTTSQRPSRNLSVSGCQLSSNCAAIKFGTESVGNFEHVRISQCAIRDTRLGGVKIFSVDGAQLHDVVISDLTMDAVTVPVMVRLGARRKTFRAGEISKPVGTLRDVTLKNVRATSAKQIGILISGIPGHPIESLTFENIELELIGEPSASATAALPENESAYPEIRMFGPAMPTYGIYARHLNGALFKNVHVSVNGTDPRPPAVFIDAGPLPPDLAVTRSADAPISPIRP